MITAWILVLFFLVNTSIGLKSELKKRDEVTKEKSNNHQKLLLQSNSHTNAHARQQQYLNNRATRFPVEMNYMDILWRMNSAGFFNHFFDFKYVLPFTTKYSRRLFIEPLHSPHYETDLILCDFLDLPGLYCLRRKGILDGCGRSFQNMIPKIRSGKSRICFLQSAFNRTNLNRQRYHIYLAPNPRLTFHKRFLDLFPEILQAMEKHWPKTVYNPRDFRALNETLPLWPESKRYSQHNFGAKIPLDVRQNSERSNTKLEFIVVHWRRGDQLSTRCDSDFVGARDRSPNCATVEEFLLHLHHERIRFPPETRFLIATNEQNPRILQILRRHQYIILGDLLKSLRYQDFSVVSFFANASILSDYSYYSTASSHLIEAEQEYFRSIYQSLRVSEQKRGDVVSNGSRSDGTIGEGGKFRSAKKLKLQRSRNRTDTIALQNKEKAAARSGRGKISSEIPFSTTTTGILQSVEQNHADAEIEEKVLERKGGGHKSKKKKHLQRKKQEITDGTRVLLSSAIADVAEKVSISDDQQKNVSWIVDGYGRGHGQSHPHRFGRLTFMEEFIIESLFMLHATVLINYGISTIHDAIESERYLRGTIDSKKSSSDKQYPYGDVSVCYMAQEKNSWCHNFEIERNYIELQLNRSATNTSAMMMQPFNLLPAYPNSALTIISEYK